DFSGELFVLIWPLVIDHCPAEWPNDDPFLRFWKCSQDLFFKLKAFQQVLYALWLHGGTVGSKKILGSNPSLGFFCMEIACSLRACVGSLQILQLPPVQSATVA
ncbi:hypothetical protein GOODEAATRI_001180, partial [Goodea atripinnis]